MATLLVCAAPALAARTVTSVTITFTKTKIAVSHQTLQAGKTTFVVVNPGSASRTLAIRGPGITHARIAKVLAGKRLTLTLTLTTGAYMFADPDAGALSVRWIVVTPATVVQAKGNGSVVQPLPPAAGMNCD